VILPEKQITAGFFLPHAAVLFETDFFLKTVRRLFLFPA
jgi:hypothetical protein